MITQLGGRPALWQTDADEWSWLQVVLYALLLMAVGYGINWLITGTFLGAPNAYNHIDWAGDGIQSAAFSLLRPWDKPPRDDMVYGIDKAEAERRAKVMKTSLSS